MVQVPAAIPAPAPVRVSNPDPTAPHRAGFKRVLEIPPGTLEVAWRIAAAWADVPLRELLADTAPVKSVHYMAALRVVKAIEENGKEQADLRQAAVAVEGPEATRSEEDQFARLMRLAEDVSGLTAEYRNSGDAIRAAKYSNFESELLQAAATIQKANDIEEN